MNNYSKVYGHEDLYRDNFTGAIINTDKSLLDKTKKSKSASEIIKTLRDDVDNLQSDISEIKNLLREIVGK